MTQPSAHASEMLQLDVEDAAMLQLLFGVQDQHLHMIEEKVGVAIHARGNKLTLKGSQESVAITKQILSRLVGLMQQDRSVTTEDVAHALRLLMHDPAVNLETFYENPIKVPTRRRAISPRTDGQRAYVDAMRTHDMIFGIGPAGTGKTYLAMAMAVESLVHKHHERIILCRPAVEAGEKLGFLPGNMQEKVNPYLRPLYDALHDMMDMDHTHRLIEDGAIEVAPLAFMRGRTLSNSFVILDEAQNCTPEQMKMFLTRMGVDSKAVITGDVTQIDLPGAVASGLVEAVRILEGVAGIHIHQLHDVDVVRHPLVQSIIRAYDHKGGGGV